MTRSSPEASFHRTVASYLDVALPAGCWWTTFPLGGGGKARGGQLRMAGTKPGVPDVLIVHEGRAYWIELKAPKGRLSEAQVDCHIMLDHAGSEVLVARSLGEIETALREWNIPLKATTRSRAA